MKADRALRPRAFCRCDHYGVAFGDYLPHYWLRRNWLVAIFVRDILAMLAHPLSPGDVAVRIAWKHLSHSCSTVLTISDDASSGSALRLFRLTV